MKEDTVIPLRQPGSFSDDPLTDILRTGAQQLLAQAIESEVAAHIEAHVDLTAASGRRRVVRHGHMPEREVQTGIGLVAVKRPRVRDRDPHATGGRIRFMSAILPPRPRPRPKQAFDFSSPPMVRNTTRPRNVWLRIASAC